LSVWRSDWLRLCRKPHFGQSTNRSKINEDNDPQEGNTDPQAAELLPVDFRRQRGDFEQEELTAFAGLSFPISSSRERHSRRTWCCGVLVFPLLLLACDKADSVPKPRIPESLVIGYPEGIGTGEGGGAAQLAEVLAIEPLTRIGADGRAVPHLATGWEWSDENRAMTLTLRPNVFLHDGRLLTASLAAEILRSVMAQAIIEGKQTSFDEVTGITTRGDLDIVLTMKRPSSFLPEDLSLPFGIFPKREKGAAPKPAIGTGPYQIVSRSDTEIVLKRFERYYRGPALIPQVVIQSFESLRTAWADFLRGGLGMVTDLPPDTVELVKSDDIEILSFRRPYQYLLAFNARIPALSNPQVRRALNIAIDRDVFVKNVLHEHGAAASGPIWPGHWAYNAALQPYKADPAEAVRLLESAGFRLQASHDPARPPARLRFSCIVPEGFITYERVVLELQRQLFAIGVDLEVDALPVRSYGQLMNAGKFEAAFIDLISAPSLNRPYMFWRSAREKSGQLNVFGYENPEAERLFQTIREARDDEDVRQATHQLQRVFMQDPPALFIAWNQRSRAVRRELGVAADSGEDPLLSLWRWGADNTSGDLASR
jgi:peptide/nickel transport system substrate-binding protein